MAHTYTPGLTVTPRTVVSKKRILPLPGTVLVEAADSVTAATVVARAELPGKVHVVHLVNQLGALPEALPDYMGKREGDRIQQGGVLAETRPFLKWFKTQVRSPITGTVETISTTAAHFTPAHAGRIVVGGAFVGTEALARARAVGVKGIVVGGMHDKDLRTLL